MVFLVTPRGSVGSVAALVVALIRDFQPSYLCAPQVACVNLMPLDVLTLRVECSLTLKIRHLISKYPDSFGQRPDLGLLLKYCEHFKNSSNHGHFGQSCGSTQVDYSSLLLSTPWRYALRWPHFWEWLGRIASNLMKTSLRVNQEKILKNSQCWNPDFAFQSLIPWRDLSKPGMSQFRRKSVARMFSGHPSGSGVQSPRVNCSLKVTMCLKFSHGCFVQSFVGFQNSWNINIRIWRYFRSSVLDVPRLINLLANSAAGGSSQQQKLHGWTWK